MQPEELLSRAKSLANTELLRDGFVPSPEQARRLLNDSDALSTEMDRVTQEITRLVALQGRISRQLEITRSTLAPIRRLPAEILSDIFVHVVKRTWSYNHPHLITSTLALVCCRWRDIAFNTPRLWSHIQARLNHYNIFVTRIITQAVKQASLASNTSLVLTIEDASYGNEPSFSSRLLAQLEPHSARFHAIDYSGLCSSFPKEPKFAFPGLQTFSMTSPVPYPSASLAFLSTASALTCLSLTFDTSAGGDPLAQLDIPTFPMLENLRFIAHKGSNLTLAPLLKAHRDTLLGLIVHVTRLDLHAPSAVVNMASLRSVDLLDNAHHVLRFITAPALQVIRISSIWKAASDPFPSLLASSSISSIKSLVLERLDLSSSLSFWDCLEQLYDLRKLQIIQPWWRPECKLLCEGTIIRLTLEEGRAPVLRHLATLSLTFVKHTLSSSTKEIEGVIRSMLASRKDARLCASLGVDLLQNFNTDIDYAASPDA
ncbi:hypothetical protein EV121DRAFT_295838 [Schizophyllum commune]